MTLLHWLIFSAVLFVVGVFGVLSRRSILGILMSIELMFNAVNVSLVAFNRYLYPQQVWGQAFALFVITLAAAEAVVGLSLVLAIYRSVKSLYTEDMNLLHG